MRRRAIALVGGILVALCVGEITRLGADYTVAVLPAMVEVLDAEAGRAALSARYPGIEEANTRAPDRRVRMMCAELELHCVFLLDTLEGHPEAYWTWDPHLNAGGNALVAEAMAQATVNQ